MFGLGLLLGLWVIGCLIALVVLRLRKTPLEEILIGYGPLMAIGALAIVFGLPMLAQPTGLDSRGIPIRGFGVMVLCGIVAGNALAVWQAKRMGVDPELIFSLAIWLFVAGFGGARLFYVVQYWKEYAAEDRLMDMLNVTQGGIVVYGAVIGASVALVLFSLRHRISVRALADLIAPAIVLGYGFGRLGCFMNGCCYGAVCELPWAVTFPPSAPVYQHQVEENKLNWHGLVFADLDGQPLVKEVLPDSPAEAAGLQPGDTIVRIGQRPVTDAKEVIVSFLQLIGSVPIYVEDELSPHLIDLPPPPQRTLPVHPTQIYSSVNGFLLALVLFAYYPLRRRDGEVIGLLLTIYPVSRFLIEAIRVDETGVWGTGLSISQNISVIILALMVLYWVWLLRQPRGSMLPFQSQQESSNASAPNFSKRKEAVV